MSIDRAQLIDFLEGKGYRIGAEYDIKGFSANELGLFREINTGCIWPFSTKVAMRVGMLDVVRSELKVYGRSLLPEMNKLKETLEELCVTRFYLTLADEEIDYLD